MNYRFTQEQLHALLEQAYEEGVSEGLDLPGRMSFSQYWNELNFKPMQDSIYVVYIQTPNHGVKELGIYSSKEDAEQRASQAGRHQIWYEKKDLIGGHYL